MYGQSLCAPPDIGKKGDEHDLLIVSVLAS